jgi:hypothetical protein
MTEKEESYEPNEWREYCLPVDFDIERGDVLVRPSGEFRCASFSNPCEFHLLMQPTKSTERRKRHEHLRRLRDNPKITIPTPRYTCCPNLTCSVCRFFKAVSEDFLARLPVDVQTPDFATVARPARADVPAHSPAQSFTVCGATWVLSCSRTWDYRSRMGSSAQEIGAIS